MGTDVGDREIVKVNLGCGADKRDGWIGMDNKRHHKPDVLHDLRDIPLPWAEGSVDLIFAEQALSQIEQWQGQRLLCDCLRILRPGGWIRINEADFEWVMNYTYNMNPGPEMGDMTPAERVQMYLNRYGWAFIYDWPALYKAVARSGFVNIRRPGIRLSEIPDFIGMEKRSGGLVLEAQKPDA